jgi:PAS domain S-box-containing protein
MSFEAHDASRAHPAGCADPECRYRELFDAVDDIIYIRDFHGVLLDINAAGVRFFGRPKEQLVGHTLHASDDDAQWQSLEATNRKLQQHGVDRSTVRLPDASGHERTLETTTTLIFDDQGRAAGAYGVMRDITSQNELQESLVVANDQLQAFARFLRTEKETTERALLEADAARHEAERQRGEAERQRQIAERAMAVIETDNARKTLELQEARDLQLSLLPKELPRTLHFEIGAAMLSAHEVGGDYYDFHVDEGSVTIALADATGHGLKAGMLVATAKSYFQTLAAKHDNVELLRTMSVGFRNMNLRSLFVCFTLLRLEGRTARFASAGMPAALLYRARSGEVEMLNASGLPLGIYVDSRYDETTLELEGGDVLLLMTDGFPELFSPAGEELTTHRVEAELSRIASLPAQGIVDELFRFAASWTASGEVSDDMTAVVVKATPNA